MMAKFQSKMLNLTFREKTESMLNFEEEQMMERNAFGTAPTQRDVEGRCSKELFLISFE